jgi:hypothetical protein
VTIESYRFGRIKVDGREYRTDLLLLPDRILDSWWRREGHNLCLEDLEQALASRPEVLVIGQGKPGLMKVPAELAGELRRRGIEVFAAPTEQAVQEYNRLREGRRTVAALHLTC